MAMDTKRDVLVLLDLTIFPALGGCIGHVAVIDGMTAPFLYGSSFSVVSIMHVLNTGL